MYEMGREFELGREFWWYMVGGMINTFVVTPGTFYFFHRIGASLEDCFQGTLGVWLLGSVLVIYEVVKEEVEKK